MSWAANRETRRIEDEAYCLMGLFGVNMPTIYGEGAKAFRRLQEEIMSHSADQTLFAWGEGMPQHILRDHLVADTHSPENSLFASSPAAFAGSAQMSPIMPEEFASRTDGLYPRAPDDASRLPEFTLSSYGVRCRLPVIDGGEYALAVLACHDAPDSCVALVLQRRRHTASTHPRYLVGAYFADGEVAPHSDADGGLRPRKTLGYRLMRLSAGHSHSFSLLTQPVTCGPGATKRIKLAAQHAQVYIAHSPPHDPHPWLRLTEPARIAFPSWLASTLKASGFEPSGVSTRGGSEAAIIPEWWAPDGPLGSLTLTFSHTQTRESFTLHFGQCDAAHGLWASVTISPAGLTDRVYAYSLDHHDDPVLHTQPPSPRASETNASKKRPPTRKSSFDPALFLAPPLALPARAARHRTRSPSPSPGARFGCAQYHIGTWSHGARAFGDDKRTVRLAFSRWPRGDTYALEVTLGGSVYVPTTPGVLREKDARRRVTALSGVPAGDGVILDSVDLWGDIGPADCYPGAVPAIVVHEAQP